MSPIAHRLTSVEQLVSSIESGCHPGLMMDKLLRGVPESQQEVGGLLESITSTRGDIDMLARLTERRRAVLKGRKATRWVRQTVAPMALHLARAALLENANVCLHRTYGFAYLPGSGLKGMARAWAETIWRPRQADQQEAQRTIDAVFGWANTPDHREAWEAFPEAIVREADGSTPVADHVGAVVFHDAWPTGWPPLVVDILASHHLNYYSAGDTQVPPPGDWESPNLVNFLTVPPGVEFEFAVSPMGGVPGAADRVGQAREFLEGALVDLGFGAKTSSGYGAFAAGKESPAWKDTERRQRFECELELVTPAFLAGADQTSPQGCDLRGATLRGQLRWWWRTMHAAHLARADLRALENAIWGSASQGGAVTLRIQGCSTGKHADAYPFDKLKILDQASAKNTEIKYRKDQYGEKPSRTVLPDKVTPGHVYISYGMDEKKGRRPYRLHGASWKVSLLCRPANLNGKTLTAEQVRREAEGALWLLLQYGGVGSKSRKGFGSLRSVTNLGTDSVKRCQEIARASRESLGMNTRTQDPHTPALEDLLTFSQPIVFHSSSRLHLLTQLGFSLSLFGAWHAHDLGKKSLGMPRKPRDPTFGDFNLERDNPVRDRHASPWHLHVAPHGDGLEVRFAAFPSPWLPNRQTSQKWLEKLRDHLEKDLALRSKKVTALNSDFGGTGEGAKSTAPPRAMKAYTAPVLAGLEKLQNDFKPESFRPGQKNCSAERIKTFLEKVEPIKDQDGVKEYLNQISDALGLHEKKKRKEYKKRAYLGPLVEFLWPSN